MSTQEELERKKLIKETARKLFTQFGFNKTSLDDIAHQSGLAKPTIYYYYPNKVAIFNEIVLEEAKRIFQDVENNLNQTLSVDKKFILFGKLLYKHLKNHASQVSNVPKNFLEYSPHGRPFVQKVRQIFQEKLSAILREGCEQGIFDIDDIELSTKALMAMSEFLRMSWLINEKEAECDRIFNEFQRILLNGLLNRR